MIEEEIVISASEANELTKNSRDKLKKEKDEASIKFLKERINPVIKKAASEGRYLVDIHINQEDSKDISEKYIVDFLKKSGYIVSCESVRILDTSPKVTELIIQWGAE